MQLMTIHKKCLQYNLRNGLFPLRNTSIQNENMYCSFINIPAFSYSMLACFIHMCVRVCACVCACVYVCADGHKLDNVVMPITS